MYEKSRKSLDVQILAGLGLPKDGRNAEGRLTVAIAAPSSPRVLGI